MKKEMTIEKLKRVMWRIREKHPNKSMIMMNDLTRAIMYEVGTYDDTIKRVKKQLIMLGWIRTHNKKIEIRQGDWID